VNFVFCGFIEQTMVFLRIKSGKKNGGFCLI